MGYKKHKQPSDKQLKVLALLEANPDMSLIKAGRLAGYSESTVRNMKSNVLDKPLVKSLLDNYRYQLEQHNINPQRLAKKLDSLLEAKQHHINNQTGEVIKTPDNKLQLETIKVLHDIYGVKQENNQDNREGLKRRLTLEEYEEKEQVIQPLQEE